MSKNPASSHRPKRDGQNAKELADLKRENFSLRKTVKRLEKEINKRAAIEVEVAEEGLQEEAERIPENTDKCPECTTGMRLIALGERQFWVCPTCKFRKKL